MNNLNKFNKCRIPHPLTQELGDKHNGMFLMGNLVVIASDGLEWDHVSVSRAGGCPSWEEMDKIKNLFLGETSVAMQLHIPPKDNISLCDTCLHIWAPQMQIIPLPPKIMVG